MVMSTHTLGNPEGGRGWSLVVPVGGNVVAKWRIHMCGLHSRADVQQLSVVLELRSRDNSLSAVCGTLFQVLVQELVLLR